MPVRSEHAREFIKLKAEIQRLNTKLRELRARKNELEELIIPILKKDNTVGIRYEDVEIVIKKQRRTKKKGKKDQRDSCIKLLEELKIDEPEEVYDKLLESGIAQVNEKEFLNFRRN